MSEEESPKQWHLERSVSVSHIVASLTMLILLGSGYASFSQRLAVLENQQAGFNQRFIELLSSQRITDVRQDGEIAETKRLIREDLKEINQKLDRITRP